MNPDELESCKQKLLPYMEEVKESFGLDMVYFMMTNILEESSEVLVCGNLGEEVIQEAFGVEVKDRSTVLKGVVSRKKQMIPGILEQLPQ
jgi:manganese-dependent inorganic pyrophosphatase